MAIAAPSSSSAVRSADRLPPYNEEAERGVLGSILLDAAKVMDLCVESQIAVESFFVGAHRKLYDILLAMNQEGVAIDVLTVTEHLRNRELLDSMGGPDFLDRLVDSTPTAAHAEYYIDIVRQKHLLRCIIDCARSAEYRCYGSEDSADELLGLVEQSFLDITERQHGIMTPWDDAVKSTFNRIELMLTHGKGVSGISTGFTNLDAKLHGLRQSEMIVVAARPSMGKTSLAMNIAENVARGKRDPEEKPHAVGVFSLEMSMDALVMRMLCSHARVSAFRLTQGLVLDQASHRNLTQAASVLSKCPIYLDDTGGLDILELRARARRMKTKHNVELIVIDYLQLLSSREYARQGRQIETANVSGNIKAMAKELKVPVIVLSQLSRAPEQRDKEGKPKLSDLRDSGAIEQDADVVLMLRRPIVYADDKTTADETLAVVDVAKHRNGPTGEVQLNFETEFTRFSDRATGVDQQDEYAAFAEEVEDNVT